MSFVYIDASSIKTMFNAKINYLRIRFALYRFIDVASLRWESVWLVRGWGSDVWVGGDPYSMYKTL